LIGALGSELIASLDQRGAAITTGLTAMDAAMHGSLDSIEQRVADLAGQAASTAAENLGVMQADVVQRCESVLSTLREGNRGTVDQFTAGLQREIDGAVSKWTSDRERSESDLRSQVDQSVSGHQKVAAEMPGELADVASSA